MGNCSSHGGNLLAAAVNGDEDAVLKILRSEPDLAFFHTFRDRTSPAAFAAEQGHRDVLAAIWKAALQSRGEAYAKQFCLNQPGSKGKTPLMLACRNGHLACANFLLANGADPLPIDSAAHGDTALHMACAGAHSPCVGQLLQSVVPGQYGQPTRLPDMIVGDIAGRTRFVDQLNTMGLCPLHLATLRGSTTTVQALLQAGASVDTRVLGGDGRDSTWLCTGSTALHLASARGSVPIALALLEAQAGRPGSTDVRRIRNSRGLRASTVARAEGHHELARLLHDMRPRRERRNSDIRGPSADLEQLMAALVQRAKLLLSLRGVVLAQKGMAPDTLTPCKLRAPSASSEILNLLATLDPARASSTSSGGRSGQPSRQPMVAAALVQAALDAVQRVTAAGATHDDGDDLAPAVSVPSADELIPGVADSRHFSRRSFRGRSPFSVSSVEPLQHSLRGSREETRSLRRRRQLRAAHHTPAIDDESFAPDGVSLSDHVSGGLSPTSMTRWRHRQRRRRCRRSTSLPLTDPLDAGTYWGHGQQEQPVGGMTELRAEGTPTSDSREGEVLRRRISSGLPVTFSTAGGAPEWATAEVAGGGSAVAPAAALRGGASSSYAGRSVAEVVVNHLMRASVESMRLGDDVIAHPVLVPDSSADSSGVSSDEDSSPDDNTPVKAADAEARDDTELCAICFDRKLEVAMIGASGACGHQMCAGCAFQLCGRGLDAPTCPFCRADIGAFESAEK